MGYNFWIVIASLASPAVLQRLWFSLWLSVVVVVIALVGGGGLAVAERLQRVYSPRWFLTICSLVLFLPPTIVGTAFIQLFGRAGDLNNIVTSLGLLPWPILYTPWAVLLAHAWYNIPLAYLGIKASVEQISIHTEDMAKICGARSVHVLRDFFWPHMRSAVLSMAGIIFLYNFTSFVLPLMLGGIHAQTLEVYLYQQVYLYHHYSTAYFVAILQTLMLGVIIAIALRGRPISIDRLMPGAAAQPASLPLRCGRWWLAGYLIAPLFSLVGHVLVRLQWSALVALVHTRFFGGLVRSGLLAAIVIPSVIMFNISARRGARWLVILLTISPVTLGFIWLLIIGRGWVSLILALIIGLLPLASYFFDHARRQLPAHLFETATVLGANVWQKKLLELNLLRPALWRVAALAAVFVLGDVTLANVLAPSTAPTGMQVALALVAHYRFQIGSVAMVIMLALIISVQSLIYARD